MFALWSAYAIWTPKNPKLRLKSCPKDKLRFSVMTCILSIKFTILQNRAQRYYFFFIRAREKSKKVHFLERKRFRKQRSGSENWVNETFARPLAKAKQTTATRRTTAVHRTANRDTKGLSGVLRIASLIAVFLEGYSWGIRGIFVGYSWDIHMYRVCVGYVSGMYRESVEGYGARGRGYGWHRKRRVELTTISTICAQINSLWALLGDGPPTDEHGWTRKKEYRHPCSQARRNNRSTEGR